MEVHYANLTRGTLCPDLPADHRFTRIQSTWGEQKRWGDILTSLGADFYMDLASGLRVTVHDVSERPRMTRALWQCVPWIRYACSRAWGLPEPDVRVRNGQDVTGYFREQWERLTRPQRNAVSYYSKFVNAQALTLEPCVHSRSI